MAVQNLYQGIVPVVVYSLLITSVQSTDVTIKTKVGTLIGIKSEVSVSGTTYPIFKFLGVPYAKPPVGKLRFRFPVARAPFKEPKIVQEFGNRCLEISRGGLTRGSEDCLYLNVYVPSRSDYETMAVMIYLHGGGFIEGAGELYHADILAGYGNAVVVTVNYRLSAWGFLSTGDSLSAGNYGLWDQQLAIRWVRDNIASFGGDADRITVFGHSAGAAAAMFQILFPGNQGLFQRVILQSGSASAAWAMTSDPKQQAEALALAVGCSNDTMTDKVECMRALPAGNINEALNNPNNTRLSFLPTVDNVFVPCKPSDILNQTKTEKVYGPARMSYGSFDLMTGTVAVEGGFVFDRMTTLLGNPENFLPNKTFFDTFLVPFYVSTTFPGLANDTKAELVRKIVDQYTDPVDPRDPTRIRSLYADIFSDGSFVGPLNSLVDGHFSLSDKPAFVYQFNVEAPSQRFLPTPSWVTAASHGDELSYLFPSANSLDSYGIDADEKALAKKLMILWTNFAKTGDPSSPTAAGIDWRPYTATSRRYLDIRRNTTTLQTPTALEKETVAFWNEDVASKLPQTGPCRYVVQTSATTHLFNYNAVVLIMTISLFVN